MFRHVKTYLIGASNSGKSTLFNCLVKRNVSTVTKKAYTTLNNSLGLVQNKHLQLFLSDTPGYTYNCLLTSTRLLKLFSRFKNASLFCFVIDLTRKCYISLPAKRRKAMSPNIIILNKIDLLHDKYNIWQLFNNIKSLSFNKLFLISGLKKKGVQSLQNFLLDSLIKQTWYYKTNKLSLKSNKIAVEDIVLEKLYFYLAKEIPYSLSVQIESWIKTDNLTLLYSVIVVHNKFHKKIVLGFKKNKVKKVFASIRHVLKMLFGQRVIFKLFIRSKF